MFTGIIAAVGHIISETPLEGGIRFTIDADGLGLDDVAIGDSIAVNGCCLTAIAIDRNAFLVDVSEETLRCTTGLTTGAAVNLEKALRLADRLGGHLVTGHVDGVGEVICFEQLGDNRRLQVRAPAELAKYIARKGSVTLNGVSLTVNRISADVFDVNLIPHTLERTILKHIKAGDGLNLEVDLIARYAERLMAASATLPDS